MSCNISGRFSWIALKHKSFKFRILVLELFKFGIIESKMLAVSSTKFHLIAKHKIFCFKFINVSSGIFVDNAKMIKEWKNFDEFFQKKRNSFY